MKLINYKHLVPAFLIALFIINCIQGATTELLADEAYYWAYSNFMDWGYFDHPPMVAVWIYISKLFFSTGEISVRFFSAITLSVTFYLVWMLIKHPKKHENQWIFVALTASTALFNVYGFITVPDTPLMFFIALFLIGYQKYLEDKSFISYLILSLSMAGMMYSKYQALLVIFFVLLSNFKIVKDYKIWLAALFSILLYTPHLYWQVLHEYPSFKYHLFERKQNSSYRFSDTTTHLLNTIAIIGFTFPVVYKAVFKTLKTDNLFFKALHYITFGFIIFFFLSTFKGHAQAQWIVAISIPLIVIPFHYLVDNPKNLKLFKILTSITVFFVIILRFAMANDGILPKQFEMHGNKTWALALQKKLNGNTPIFANSYQNPSTYWFYTGERPYEYNAWNSRKNQYDLWNYNRDYVIDNGVEINYFKKDYNDSVRRRNTSFIKLKNIVTPFKEVTKTHVSLKENVIIKPNTNYQVKVNVLNPYQYINQKDIEFKVAFKQKRQKILIDAKIADGILSFTTPSFKEFIPNQYQVVGKIKPMSYFVRMGDVIKIKEQ